MSPASSSQSQSQDEQLEKGGFGAVTGAEEVTLGNSGRGGANTQKKDAAGSDKALEKGGLGAIAGAEEVKAKL